MKKIIFFLEKVCLFVKQMGRIATITLAVTLATAIQTGLDGPLQLAVEKISVKRVKFKYIKLDTGNS